MKKIAERLRLISSLRSMCEAARETIIPVYQHTFFYSEQEANTMVEIQVPNLGQSGMDVKLERWFVKEGDHIEKGSPLYELSNEKLTQEIESPVSGTLTKILVPEGETTPVGAIIGQIEE
jgi:biotin carboxyl carrier protein